MNRGHTLSPVWNGALAGLGAGLVSGIVLRQMWVLTPLPLMLGQSPGVGLGWIIHLAIAVIFGAVFGAIFRQTEMSRSTILVAGVLTGILVWAIGPLYLIPVLIGLPPQFGLMDRWLEVGFAYVLYGLCLGAFYILISNKSERRA